MGGVTTLRWIMTSAGEAAVNRLALLRGRCKIAAPSGAPSAPIPSYRRRPVSTTSPDVHGDVVDTGFRRYDGVEVRTPADDSVIPRRTLSRSGWLLLRARQLGVCLLRSRQPGWFLLRLRQLSLCLPRLRQLSLGLPCLRQLGLVVAAVIGLPGCINAYYQAPPTVVDEAAYAAIYPYFAEYCAVSEFDKKKGFGVNLEGGGPGGHSVFYLNGACRVHDAGYPVLALCDETPQGMAGRGVGLSVNDHYRNANWTATEGRDFFYHGDLAPGEAVTPAAYERIQAKAEAMGVLDGVAYHRKALEPKPEGMSVRDYMYNVAIGTDYAIDIDRYRYCARVPLDRDKMGSIVRYLNGLNEPYRTGAKVFHWNVLRDNCTYLAHNALAVVGLWPQLPPDRPLLLAAFDFPVPKNEFVNVMWRTNNMPIADPDALYDDATARKALLQLDWIATEPGALAEATPEIEPNEIYNDHLRLIFYDEPVFGHFQTRFNKIFAEPRYTDLTANLTHFSSLYAAILARPQTPHANAARAAFEQRYRDVIAAEKAKVDSALARLSGAAG
jgi:hypothetical protein